MTDFLKVARTIADEIGGCDPLWLHNQVEPSYNVRESTSSHPEILMVHGLLGALSNWDSVFPLMESYCKPMAIELPLLSGHRSEVKIKALAIYIWYLIKKRKLDPVILCGNSLGGHVALRLYLADPSVVDCLILTGTSGLYEHSVDTLPVRPAHDFIREHMARVFVNEDFINEESIEGIYQLIKDRKNVLNLIHAARSAKRDNLLERLGEITVPTLLLWGENDQVTPMDVAETFHKNIPNSELITIDRCGHAPMIEHPEWFSEQVEKFVKKHSSRYGS